VIGHPGLLAGTRVRLRPYAEGFSEAELRELYQWGCDEGLVRLAGGNTLDMPYPRFRDLFLRQLPTRNSNQQQLFAVLNESAEMIGRIGLFAFNESEATAELGVVIGDSRHWGQGYGREAVRLLTDHAFDDLGLLRVILFTFQDNERAQRAFAAAGFRMIKEVRKFSFDRGLHTEIEMHLESDWRGPRQTVGVS
jgi:RimJ/RimL family protein N-acetyltransferase